MKHYDPKAVEALVQAAFVGRGVAEAIAAVRASACEAGEVSEREVAAFMREIGHTVNAADIALVIAALARFAAPRGRVVEGWALVWYDDEIDGIYTRLHEAEHVADPEQRVVPCLITIPDAPPRGQEETEADKIANFQRDMDEDDAPRWGEGG